MNKVNIELAIALTLHSTFNFIAETRKKPNSGKPISVPADIMIGFMMITDFLKSNPRAILVNADKPDDQITLHMDLLDMLKAYVEADLAVPCDCPVCTADRADEMVKH